MTKKNVAPNRTRFVVLGAVALLLMAGLTILVVGIVREGRPKEQKLLETIEAYQGYTREVGREEYDFYAALVKRDLTEEVNEEELTDRVKEFANGVNATFYLGNKLGLCEPYSFENLQTQMQYENNARRLKKEKGEPIYGLEQFELNSYFQYEISNLKIDLLDYLVEHADRSMEDEARAYYEANPETNRETASITYQIVENGEVSMKTQSREELRSLRNLDGELFDFLAQAKQGDAFSYELSGSYREVEVTGISYIETTFEENKEEILKRYLEEQVYDALISSAAQKNPLQFVLDGTSGSI